MPSFACGYPKLMEAGYPPEKILCYRDGMYDWVILEFTTPVSEMESGKNIMDFLLTAIFAGF